ncbi:MAG: cytochrome c biogenesis protein CcsA [Bacteroidaceae bacterium]|jgi:ABC-type transport system involved in cytochrome c biogenesis permease subunit
MKRLPFLLLLLLCAVMGTATFLEKDRGSQAISEAVYHSGWFILLWTALLFSGLWVIVRRKGRRMLRLPALLLHAAFVLILAGAMLTHLTSTYGLLHLRQGIPENTFRAEHKRYWSQEETASLCRLPFRITLQEFRIICYPGTQAPADYASTVVVSHGTFEKSRGTLDEKSRHFSEEVPQVISMNRILRVKGYRLYQSSYDPDGKGSWLMVNYDPYGIPVTYAGYALLALSMLLILLDPKGTFRRLLHHPALRRTTAALLLLAALPTAHLQARQLPRLGHDWLATQTIPAAQAGELGKLQVLYNDRIAPLHTLARDFTLKLTGTARYRGMRPEQFLAGWLFFPQVWQYEPFFRIKNDELRTRLEIDGQAAFVNFFGEAKDYKLQFLWDGLARQDKDRTPLAKAVLEANEQVQLIAMLQGGALLKVFPLPDKAGHIGWYSPTDSLPPGTDVEKTRFVRSFFSLLYERIEAKDFDEVTQLIGKLAAYQQQAGGTTLLSEAKLRAEIGYNRFEPTAWLYRICLTLGLCGFLIFLFAPSNSAFARKAGRILRLTFPLVFLALTATVALRSYISGRLPLGNGYETMLFLAWSIQLFALFLSRRLPQLGTAFGFLLSGFALLVSTLGQMNPQITPLMPVLLSPWLSLHVSVIMMAYALYAFTCICGLSALLLMRQKRMAEVEKLTVVSRLLLYPATFLLGIGIFVGAVWANASWGTYWSWDPKEVWALISFLLYALPLHRGSLPLFRNARTYHIYMAAAFLSLLMTYFGVNYFLGGMHSYAG